MAQVHSFPVDNNLYPDTRIPFQFRGNAQTPAARAFELSALIAFINANITIPNPGPTTHVVTGASPNVAVAAGKLVEKIVVIGGSTATFQLGTTPGASDILDNSSEYSASGAVFAFDKYFNTAGQLCFSGFSGTLTVKVYSR